MIKMSTGDDSTLENYYNLCLAIFGDESKATRFIKAKMEKQGKKMEVIQDERQMVFLLGRLHLGEELCEGQEGGMLAE
jgi:hypothetical protein